MFALSALAHHLPLDSTVVFIIALVMGIGVLAIGALRLFDVGGGENR